MNIAFNIEPFVGAHPIRFGMSRAEVHQLLGEPESSQAVWGGSGTTDFWNESRISVGYDTDGIVNHVGFVPGGCELQLLNAPLWSLDMQPDPNPELMRRDMTPVESVGILYFRDLGISTTGYHDDDENQRALSVMPHGAWDVVDSPCVEPSLKKYR